MPVQNHLLPILFLCTGNSCRSQMAEAWTKQLYPDMFSPFSAGVVKHGLNPHAVRVMAEVGIDMSNQQSKLIEDLPQHDFAVVITLCDHANSTCPYFPGEVLHRGFADPPQLARTATTAEEMLQAYRTVRDQIRDYIADLPKWLAENTIDIYAYTKTGSLR